MPSDTQNLTPGFIIYANGTRLAPEVEAAVKRVRVTGRINALSSFAITLSDPERTLVDSDGLFVGVQVKILMGYKDAVKEVAVYEVTGMNAVFGSDGGVSVTPRGHCCLQRLNHARVNRAYNKMNVADIVKKIAGLYSLSAETDIDSQVKPFTMQRELTDFEYLLLLAREHSCFIWGDNKKLYFKKDTDAGKEEIILEKGKTLLGITGPGATSARLFTQVRARGRDPKKGTFIEAIAGPDSVKRKIGSGTVAPVYLEKTLGEKYIHDIFDYSITDRKSAEKIAEHALWQSSMEYIRLFGECEGNPNIRAGMTIIIKGMGDNFSGKYLVKQVEHELIPMHGYVTSFEIVRNTRGSGSSKVKSDSGSRQAMAQPEKKKTETRGVLVKKKEKPEFSNLQWENAESKKIDACAPEETVTLTAQVKNADEGESISVKVYKKEYKNDDDFLESLSANVKGGKIKTDWKVPELKMPAEKKEEKEEKEQKEKGSIRQEYIFKLFKDQDVKSVDSASLNAEIRVTIKFKTGADFFMKVCDPFLSGYPRENIAVFEVEVEPKTYKASFAARVVDKDNKVIKELPANAQGDKAYEVKWDWKDSKNDIRQDGKYRIKLRETGTGAYNESEEIKMIRIGVVEIAFKNSFQLKFYDDVLNPATAVYDQVNEDIPDVQWKIKDLDEKPGTPRKEPDISLTRLSNDKDNYSYPACYKKEEKIELEIKLGGKGYEKGDKIQVFTGAYDDTRFKGTDNRDVAVDGKVKFNAADGSKLPDKITKISDYELEFCFACDDGGKLKKLGTVKTKKHIIYTVLADPVEPWGAGHSKLWVSVLEKLCNDWVKGLDAKDKAAASVVEKLFHSGLTYDTVRGGCHFSNQNYVGLKMVINFLNKKHPSTYYNNKFLNCSDCAGIVTSLANALGCELYSSEFSSTIYDGFTCHKIVCIGVPGWDYPFAYVDAVTHKRTGGFSYHAIGWEGGCGRGDKIWDACLMAANDPVRLPGMDARYAENMIYNVYEPKLVVDAAYDKVEPDTGKRKRKSVI